jgi:hypothetical protein
MSAIKIEFEWSRAYSKTPGEPAYKIANGKILQVGRGRQRYAPLTHQSLFLEFQSLDGSPQACAAFAQKWGLLTVEASTSGQPSEDLSFWRAEIKRMRASVGMLPHVVRVANSRGTFMPVGLLNVLLVPGPGPAGTPVMVMEPRDLLQAMNLEMAHFFSGGGLLLVCKQCQRYFQAGRGGDSKRVIARFCSNKCKHDFHNAQRRRG